MLYFVPFVSLVHLLTSHRVRPLAGGSMTHNSMFPPPERWTSYYVLNLNWIFLPPFFTYYFNNEMIYKSIFFLPTTSSSFIVSVLCFCPGYLLWSFWFLLLRLSSSFCESLTAASHGTREFCFSFSPQQTPQQPNVYRF